MEQIQQSLTVPEGKVDAVLDTDAFNEIDDQFAIAYLIRSIEKINVKALCAAPFRNSRVKSVREGMEKSYDEILRLRSLLGVEVDVWRGSESYLENEHTPVLSEAAKQLAALAKGYTAENPLFVVAIGAITNVASALLLDPEMKDRVVVVWLGGHAHHYHHTKEFNLAQDIAAARVVMQSGVRFVQLPCAGVVDRFAISKPELEFWFCGKNALADYLATNAIREAESYAAGKPWTRVIWDVTAVAWLLNGANRFMRTRVVPRRLPTYDGFYEETAGEAMVYVFHIKRDELMQDLIEKLTK